MPPSLLPPHPIPAGFLPITPAASPPLTRSLALLVFRPVELLVAKERHRLAQLIAELPRELAAEEALAAIVREMEPALIDHEEAADAGTADAPGGATQTGGAGAEGQATSVQAG